MRDEERKLTEIKPARPAATMLLLRDDPFEVLMVRRTDRANAAFASALVFPGGTVDADDAGGEWLPLVSGAQDLDEAERALRIAGCRETFEEVGIVLASGGGAVCAARDTSAAGTSFRALVAAAGATLPLDQLVPFGHWITPEQAPRRYDTHFYVCRGPDGAEAVCDGDETVAIEWVAPADALAMAARDERKIVFPTRMNLKRLAESGSVDAALATARARPPFTVIPQLIRRDGAHIVTIPEAAGYGVTEDARPGGAPALSA